MDQISEVKAYIGDSVYATTDPDRRGGFQDVKLTTENGERYGPSNTIYIDRDVWLSLKEFVKRHTDWDKNPQDPNLR